MDKNQDTGSLDTWKRLGPITADQINKNNHILTDNRLQFGVPQDEYGSKFYQGQVLNRK